jgi:hypothetical protein
MKTIAVIIVSEDWVAHANHNGERRLPACSVRQLAEHIFSNVGEIRAEGIAAGQAARQDRLEACAPQSFPFWTWFIDNPPPRFAQLQ